MDTSLDRSDLLLGAADANLEYHNIEPELMHDARVAVRLTTCIPQRNMD